MIAKYEKETGLWVITHGSKWGKEQFVGKTFADALGLFCRTIDARRAKAEAHIRKASALTDMGAV